MPYYKGVLDELTASGRTDAVKRICAQILKLRRGLARYGVPKRNLTQTLLLATWNLREFGKNSKFGSRTNESLLYIAEIISHFDLVAVQEVNQNLRDLRSLLALLGDWWDYIVTDVTDGRSGNEERIALLFDARKIRFDHVAGELVFPVVRGKKTVQAARSPFLCTFKAGWRRFTLCSVHIYYGTANPNDRRRVAEIARIAQLLADRNARRAKAPDGEPDDVILLGDFNIFNQQGDKTTKALTSAGFELPKEITKLPGGSNVKADKYYDQIAYLNPRGALRSTRKAGVFSFFDLIYRDEDCDFYVPEMQSTDGQKFGRAKDRLKYFKQWRTFQMSDHSPLWIELNMDFSEGYLVTRGGFSSKRKPANRRSTRGTH
jgi:endonuclease/exonuclease/phosphatase family metal-dependent hydrolase